MRKASLFATALLACAPAHAVSVSARGTGQVLLFPYYTADAGQQTLLTVVNPTASARALRVRFAESRNGRPVLSLGVYLAANDTWTAAVFADATGPARLVSFDRSCALATSDAPLAPGTPVAFSSAAYVGDNRDWDPQATPAARAATLAAPERTRRGFVEVIEMGRLRAGVGALELADELNASSSSGCAAIATAWRTDGANGWRSDPSRAIELPAGGLFGNAAVVDVADGAMLSYVATALDDFYTVASAPGALHAAPDAARPALDDARNTAELTRVRVVRSAAAPVVESFPAARAIDAVSLALMATIVRGDHNADPALAAATEWLVAMPTKRFYTDVATDAAVRAPFTDAFRDDGRAQELVTPELHRRNGNGPGTYPYECVIGIGIPPPNPCPDQPTIGQAVNVVSWSTTSAPAATPVFAARPGDDATHVLLADLSLSPIPTGWASLEFREPRAAATANVLVAPGTGNAYRGLPVIAIGATQLVNENVVPGVLANYGDATPLWSRLDVSAAATTEAQR